MQSVYKAGQSKAELLHAVVDLAVAGDDEDIVLADRAVFAAIGDEADPRRQVQRFADLIASIQERSAPVQAAYRQAAAVDDTCRGQVSAAAHRRRLETLHRGGRDDSPASPSPPTSRIRRDRLGDRESGSCSDCCETQHGWDAARYRRWLRATLVDVLLLDSS